MNEYGDVMPTMEGIDGEYKKLTSHHFDWLLQNQIVRGVIGAVTGFIVLLVIVHILKNDMDDLIKFFLNPQKIIQPLIYVGILGIFVGMAEIITRKFDRSIGPAVFGAFGIIIIGIMFFLEQNTVFFNKVFVRTITYLISDVGYLTLKGIIFVWMLIVGIVRQYRDLNVISGSFLESSGVFLPIILIIFWQRLYWPNTNLNFDRFLFSFLVLGLVAWTVVFFISIFQRVAGGMHDSK